MATEAESFFKHCVPVLHTTMPRCGGPIICENTSPETLDSLLETYGNDDNFKIIGDLLMSNFALKATSCGIKQSSFRDFLVANIKSVKHMISPDNFTDIDKRIRPYLLAEQKMPINNNYWHAYDGATSGDNWAVKVQSTSGIPANVGSFHARERVYIESDNGGSLNIWQGEVVTAALVSDYILLTLTPQNDNSYFPDIVDPTEGILRRGPPVVGQYEEYCSSEPTYLNKRMQDYWVQWTRDTFCDSEITREFYDYVLKKNPLYKTFFHKPKIEEARESLEAFWNKLFENAMWNRPSDRNQNLNDFTSLPRQNLFLSDTGLGFSAGECVGYVAENVGWMEQWQRCKSIVDLQGDALNMWSLIDLAYDLKRVRFQTGSPATVRITAFADLSTAELIDTGFIRLQNSRTDGAFRITMDVNGGGGQPTNPFGFQFRSYRLPGKGYGIILDVITDNGFDDYISEWATLNNSDMGRNLWFLDPTNFYLGIVHSEKTTNMGGGIADLAKVGIGQCVQKVMSKDVSILGLAFTSIVECAARDRLLRNFSDDAPSITKEGRPDYTLTHDASLSYQWNY